MKKNVGIEKKLLIFNDSITAPGCMATGTCIQVYVYNLHVWQNYSQLNQLYDFKVSKVVRFQLLFLTVSIISVFSSVFKESTRIYISII